MSKINFEFTENLTVVEYGFLRDETMFVLYNSNDKPESGFFALSLQTHSYTSDITLKADGDQCQKIVL